MSCSCGCGSGTATTTPASTYNRPGLPALSYRIGTHSRFRETMLARIASRPALARLTTREPDDPAIALLDCWAMVGDVLTFYQERIANEGYLRTAIEPESLIHLGKLVGYTPRPALSASTHLAFTLDPGTKSVIPAGSGAKSVSGQSQVPQTFETTEDLIAREEWNALQVARNQPVDVNGNTAQGIRRIGVEGTSANLKTGDRLLFLFGTGTPVVRTVEVATPDFAAGRTDVTLTVPDGRRNELNQAIEDLADVIGEALPAPVSPWTADSVALLTAAKKYLATVGEVTVVPYRLLRTAQQLSMDLPEQAAIAAAHAGCGVQDWYDLRAKRVIDAAVALLKLILETTRDTDYETAYLKQLAHDLFCPSQELLADGRAVEVRDCGKLPCTDCCNRGTALVALTPVLPWLRRDPSRPPRRAIDLKSTVDDLFRADSDVHPKLLMAADPRLGPNLHKAWGNQQIAPPPALSGLQVPRVKAVTIDRPAGTTDPDGTTVLYLDNVYDGIARDSWVVLDPGANATSPILQPEPAQVVSVTQATVDVTVKDASGAAKPVGTKQVTVLTVRETFTQPPPAGTIVWAQGESLTAVGDPITDAVAGTEIELGRLYDGLRPGRWLVVSGERTDVPHTTGIQASELTMVAGIRQRVNPEQPGAHVRTYLALATTLSYQYRRATVTLYGNVVAADQGETRSEVLGSGDPGTAGQTFPLRQVTADNPLTFLPSANAEGAESTLTTRVSGVRWHETDGLIRSGPAGHDYEEVVAPDGTRSVRFGDGVHGARVPAGVENVIAEYRIGAGHNGNVDAGQINQLSGRAPGVRSVLNPLPSGGGADGDGPADARETIPLRMLALDRLLSVRDYADFTRARAGIGKAAAVQLSDGDRQVVHVTIAATGDVRIDPSSGLFTTLEDALAAFGDRGVPVRVAVRDQVLLVLRAGIKVLPDYSWNLVEPAVRAALLDRFSFAHRELGEPAYLSEVFSAIQAVPGVDYADVDMFDGISGAVTPIELATIVDGLTQAKTCVPAAGARFEEVFDTVGYVNDFGWDTLTTVALRNGLTLAELVRLNPRLDSAQLPEHGRLTVFRGIRPARLAVLPAAVPEALTLVRIP
ncbi:putative baseplate assembly protein [Amycolatopsis panacis]|uniref:Putative baseplate assembly protein n=1 Tax=Amycolatopsis panacis TaxID=2340917 RepID=A0A419I3M8_9PSEU|nr:putative baseplate assembly protein [Amycolatopsis panacis]RJQ84783.1 putative baseplate assembly protein [Amycolatopsis panacis]